MKMSNLLSKMKFQEERYTLSDGTRPRNYYLGFRTDKFWDKVFSKLSELDTTKLHYVRVPENHAEEM